MTACRHTPSAESYPQSELRGTVTIIGDIIGPVLPEHHWDSLAGARSPTVSAGEQDPGIRRDPKGGSK